MRINDPTKLVGYWKLNGNTKDYSGHGNDGTIVGTPTYSEDAHGNKTTMDFGTGNNFINLGQPSEYEFSGRPEMSFFTWANFTSTTSPSEQGFISRGDNTTYGRQLNFEIHSGGTGSPYLMILLYNETGYASFQEYLPRKIIGEWVQVGYIMTSTEVQFYFNGEKLGSPKTLTIDLYVPDKPWVLGRSIWGDYYSINGKMDESRLYNIPLTPSEVKQLYQLDYPRQKPTKFPIDTLPDTTDTSLVGSWLNKKTFEKDLSSNGNDGTNAGVIREKVGGEFDGGTSNFSSSTDFIGKNPLTISAWIKPEAWGGLNVGRIVDNSKTFFSLLASDSKLYASSDGATIIYSGDDSISLNKWQYAVFTRNASGVGNFYIDGILSGTANQDSGTPATGSTIYIANNAALNRGFDGNIKNVEVYSEAKSADWVKNEYQKGNPDKSLVLHTLVADETDLSVNNIEFTNSGVIVGDGGEFDGSANLEISNYSDYIDTLILDTDYTLSLFVKLDSLTETHSGLIKLGLDSSSNQNNQYELWVSNSGTLYYTTGDGTTGSWDSFGTSATISAGEWYHIVATKSADTTKSLYLDGVLQGTPVQDSLTGDISSPIFLLGSTKTLFNLMDGKLKNVKVFNEVKNADWVKQEYNENKKFY